MFSFFKRSADKQAAKELKKVRKENQEGKRWCCWMCLKFTQYILDNESKISENIFIREEDSPYPKNMVQLASIDLLNLGKKNLLYPNWRKILPAKVIQMEQRFTISCLVPAKYATLNLTLS